MQAYRRPLCGRTRLQGLWDACLHRPHYRCGTNLFSGCIFIPGRLMPAGSASEPAPRICADPRYAQAQMRGQSRRSAAMTHPADARRIWSGIFLREFNDGAMHGACSSGQEGVTLIGIAFGMFFRMSERDVNEPTAFRIECDCCRFARQTVATGPCAGCRLAGFQRGHRCGVERKMMSEPTGSLPCGGRRQGRLWIVQSRLNTTEANQPVASAIIAVARPYSTP
jgi:hypothetical protein